MLSYKTSDGRWEATDKVGRDPIAATHPTEETTLFCDLPGTAADEWKTLLCTSYTGVCGYLVKSQRELEKARRMDPSVGPGSRVFGYQTGCGGFTAHLPEHWAFEGSLVREGEMFGREETICGTEVDGLELDWGSGRPQATGHDGVPTDVAVLATCKVMVLDRPTYAEGSGDGSSYGVIVCREGAGGRGTVFNAATIEWSHGLRTSKPVQTITRNVLARLSA